jgi:hypothetical protein
LPQVIADESRNILDHHDLISHSGYEIMSAFTHLTCTTTAIKGIRIHLHLLKGKEMEASLDIYRRPPRLCSLAFALGVLPPACVRREDRPWHAEGLRQVSLLPGEDLELIQLQRLRRQ